MKPNYEMCQECKHWDDVNGCWINQKNVLLCEFYNEEDEFIVGEGEQ